MLFSVIIPTCHRNDLLAKCLDCLAPGKQTLAPENYEVIVTDDGSKSTGRELIQEHYPWVKWIEGPRRGAAANRNSGAKCARGDWLVFTDDDCLPDSLFLSAFMDAVVEADTSVLEGKTSPADIRIRVDMECPANEYGGFLWSCNMAIRKKLFSEMGGFDTNFPGPAMEDVDFRTRLVKSGEKFKFVPRALVLHPWRLKKGFAFLKLYSESRGYFVTKHPETANSISLRSLGVNLVRQLVRQTPPVALACRGRGLLRDLVLTFYAAYASIIYSKRDNSGRSANNLN